MPASNDLLKKASEKRVVELLDADELKVAQNYAQSLDEKDSHSVLDYGADAQKNIANFSSDILTSVQAKDLGEVGGSLTDLMYNLKEANPNELVGESRGVKKLFGRVKRSIFEITQKYQKIGAGIDKISARLQTEQEGLLKDNGTLDALYDENLNYFKSLNVYIAGAELKIEQLNKEVIPTLKEEIAASADSSFALQQLNDIEAYKDRLDKRKYDLEIARQMTIQQAPQIRLIQNTNQELVDKIQTSINTAIPLWKNQVAIALTLLKQRDALTSQKIVSQTTNDLLLKNAQMIKSSAIEAAKENERGFIDIETLKTTQQNLIDTIQETLQIQAEGHQKRQQCERELTQMEEEIKAKLLQMSAEKQAV